MIRPHKTGPPRPSGVSLGQSQLFASQRAAQRSKCRSNLKQNLQLLTNQDSLFPGLYLLFVRTVWMGATRRALSNEI
jgi:hypothetical protein